MGFYYKHKKIRKIRPYETIFQERGKIFVLFEGTKNVPYGRCRERDPSEYTTHCYSSVFLQVFPEKAVIAATGGRIFRNTR